jgi:peptidoglycan/xylan/chitin deacetylase (PgdA/CDA1 family)
VKPWFVPGESRRFAEIGASHLDLPHRVVQLAKWAIALVLRGSGVLRFLRSRRARRGEVTILWLHRVDGSPREPIPMAIPPDVFRRIVAGLRRTYDIVRWDDAVRATRVPTPRPLIVVTFDDGYRDNVERAWPILREAGVPALFCVTTSFLSGTPLWWEIVARRETPVGVSSAPRNGAGEGTYGPAEAEIERLKAVPNRERARAAAAALATLESAGLADRLPGALSWEEARVMAGEGAEFGGHTDSHPILTRCTDEELEAEVRGARAEMIQRLGPASGAVFAYPNGAYDERVLAGLRASGYTHALTIEKGTFSAATDPFRVPRWGVSEPKYSIDGNRFSLSLFEAEILGVFDVLLLRGAKAKLKSVLRGALG